MKIDLTKVDKRVIEILNILTEAGFQGFLVGGAIRSILLDKEPKDFDIASNAAAEQIISIFPNSKLIGAHFQVVLIEHNGLSVEIARFRKDVNDSEGRSSSADFDVTLNEDLARRDITCNAMAMDLNGLIVDLFNGMSDIEKHRIQFVGKADDRVKEDPIRILRAIRIGMKSFEQPVFTDDTFHAILGAFGNEKENLGIVSQERITAELSKIFTLFSFKHLKNTRLMSLLKELMCQECVFGSKWQDSCWFDQKNPHHDEALHQHVFRMTSKLPNKLEFKLAGLLHDIAKPSTQVLNPKTGFMRYIGHEVESAIVARELLTKMKFSNDVIDKTVDLIASHMFLVPKESEKMNQDRLDQHVAKLMIKIAERKLNVSIEEMCIFAICDKTRVNNEVGIISIITECSRIIATEKVLLDKGILSNRKQLSAFMPLIMQAVEKQKLPKEKINQVLWNVCRNANKHMLKTTKNFDMLKNADFIVGVAKTAIEEAKKIKNRT